MVGYDTPGDRYKDTIKLEESNNESILTDEEIDIFQWYIEDAKVDIAFGNSDWCEVYNKIVNGNWSDYAKEKLKFYVESVR